MLKPIDMQVIVKNVDQVAKVRKVEEQTLTGQQINAQNNMGKEIAKENTTVVNTKETEQNNIGKEENKKNRERELKKKEEEKKEKEKSEHKAKEPNKGRVIDFEV